MIENDTPTTGTLEIRRGVAEGQVLPGLRDLRVEPGEALAVVGAANCGKSTLLRLILGLEPDFEGQLLLDGRPVTAPGLERGIVFQEQRLLPWLTVRQNIAASLLNSGMTPGQQRFAVRDQIAQFGLKGHEDAYPQQLGPGLAERVALARALAPRPAILLLDDPFAALESVARTRLQDELRRIWREERFTMVMTTRDVDEALYLADRVLVLAPRPGRLQQQQQQLRVDLPHPRQRGGAAFDLLRQRVLQAVREGAR